jgi:hypothetical protein
MPSMLVRKYVQMFRVSGRTVHGVGAVTLGPAPSDMETVKWLYEMLTILDAKAGALLAFDGLMLAAEALMYDKIAETFVGRIEWVHRFSLILIVVTLIAALLCLYVAQMSYGFLGNIVPGTNDNSAEIALLEKTAEVRTVRLGFAWGLSVVAVGIFILLAVIVLMKG